MVAKITTRELTGLTDRKATFVIEYVKDWATERAAEAAGYARSYGSTLKDMPDVIEAVRRILDARLEYSNIDAEWVMYQAVDNHYLARQQGNITASNTALALVGKNVIVDAFAADKVQINSDDEVMARLIRGRKRNSDDVSFL